MTTTILRFFTFLLFLFLGQSLFAQLPEGVQIINHNLVYNGDFVKGNIGFQTAYSYSYS